MSIVLNDEFIRVKNELIEETVNNAQEIRVSYDPQIGDMRIHMPERISRNELPMYLAANLDCTITFYFKKDGVVKVAVYCIRNGKMDKTGYWYYDHYKEKKIDDVLSLTYE